MSLRWYGIVIDSHDLRSLSRWWADVLGWRVEYEDEHESWIVPKDAPIEKQPSERWQKLGPGICFVPVAERKQVKNRLHIDLAPWIGDDHANTVASLLAKGATRVDVGQDPDPAKTTWAVLADPEGNEFCVLAARDQ